ncbi:MAG: glycosyltransferase [Akkermansiaceae bacterium]
MLPSRSNPSWGIKLSVIIPAHNEENFLPGCLSSIDAAQKNWGGEVEIVVVLNRCSDRTEEIARAAGAVIAKEEAKNLSRIRNAGIAASSGKMIMTIDADSRFHPMTFCDVAKKLESGRYVGGGAMVYPERYSMGIITTGFVAALYLAKFNVSFGTFWTTRAACEAMGGFNPEFVTIEDVDFAVRLKKFGKHRDQKFGTLWRSALTTSCRKFDQFGDWHLVRDSGFVARAFTGKDQVAGDEYWYEPGR